MAASSSAGLGPLEADALQVLWDAGEPLAVRDVMERLNAGRKKELAYTTVMTILARLAEKGALRREPAGRAYRYEPVAADPAGLAVREVIRDFGPSAVAAFVDEAQADPALLRRLEALLKERQ